MERLKREGVNRLFIVKAQPKKTGTFTVPPAVAPLNYIRSGIHYFGRFFAKLRYFAGFSLYIINFPVRISAAAMGGRHLAHLG